MAKPMGGGKPVVLAGERDWLLARLERECDPTLSALVVALREERGIEVCRDTLWRFLKRYGKSFKKKTLFAKEQDRPDVVRRRARCLWFQRRIDPATVRRMVFIDETWAKTNMTRTHG